jgi:hypothetical protein
VVHDPNACEKAKRAFHEPEGKIGVSAAAGGKTDGGFAVLLALKRSPGRRDACPTLGPLTGIGRGDLNGLRLP